MRLLTTLYGILLHLYPQSFRERFGEEMACDFSQALDEAIRDRRVRRFLGSILRDVLTSVIREHAAVFRPGAFLAALAVLASGLLLGWVDSKSAEVQGTLIVLLIGSGLVGLIWRRGALLYTLLFGLGVPFFILRTDLSLAALIPFGLAFVGMAVGTGVRRILVGPLGMVVAIAMGLLLGATDMLVGTPVIAIAGAFLGGVAFGRWRSHPLRAAALFGLFEPVGVIVLMAARVHAARHHYVLVDALSILYAVAGAVLGAKFREEDAARGDTRGGSSALPKSA
jgi:hypothetical protein